MTRAVFALAAALAAGCHDDPGPLPPPDLATAAPADLATPPPRDLAAPAPPTLSLVSARDHLEAYLLTPSAVFADAGRIYLASVADGRLLVLARDRAADFPVVEALPVFAGGIGGVRGDAADDGRLYVPANDGRVHLFRRTVPRLAPEGARRVSDRPLAAAAVAGQSLFVAVGQAAFAADGLYAYLAALNDEGEVLVELALPDLAPVRTLGTVAEPFRTVVYDRRTGARLTALDNPRDVLDRPSGIALYADGTLLARTIPGCCGGGVRLDDPVTLHPRGTIARPGTNTVVRRGRLLIAGNEGGQVEVYDLDGDLAAPVAAVDLRQATGHTGSEDIEIRALWTDEHDDLVFAGSSFGNDQSRGPELPSFFVLSLR